MREWRRRPEEKDKQSEMEESLVPCFHYLLISVLVKADVRTTIIMYMVMLIYNMSSDRKKAVSYHV